MKNNGNGVGSIDEYIKAHPPETQKILEELRATIKSAAPEATEKISYQMPTFYLHGNLVHFAAFKDHISFFPGEVARISQEFGSEISQYVTGKGTLQFPRGEPIPLDLVRRIVKLRVTQNLEKAEVKKSGKKKSQQ